MSASEAKSFCNSLDMDYPSNKHEHYPSLFKQIENFLGKLQKCTLKSDTGVVLKVANFFPKKIFWLFIKKEQKRPTKHLRSLFEIPFFE